MVTAGKRSPVRIGVRAALLLLIAGALWLAFDRIDWRALWHAVLEARLGWILAGVAAAVLSHLVRAHRWRLLITDGRSIPLLRAFSATIIGYMCNNIVPRSGELVRPWVLARSQQRPLSGMIASVVVERILDGLTLGAIVLSVAFVAGELLVRLLPEYTSTQIVLAIIAPVAALAVAAFVLMRTSLGDRLLSRFGGRLPEGLVTRARSALEGFRSGVSFSSRGVGLLIAAETVVIWAGYAAGLWFSLLAFGFHETYGLGLGATLVTLSITSIAITIAPTPGGFVVFHTFCVAVLTGVFGVDASEAAAFAILTHGAPYIVITAMGAAFAVSEDLSIAGLLSRRVMKSEE